MPGRGALTASFLIALTLGPGAAAQTGAAPQQRLSVELGRAEREIVLQPGHSDVLQLPRPARTITLDRSAVSFPEPGEAEMLVDKSWDFRGQDRRCRRAPAEGATS